MKKTYFVSVLCLLVILTMLNGSPFCILYQHKLYWPWFRTYFETDFGGTYSLLMDYHDPDCLSLIEDAYIMPYGYGLNILISNHGKHLFGILPTQQDALTYGLIAIINTVFQCAILTTIATFGGTIVGMTIGYYYPKYRTLSQSLIDICRTVPFALILIISHQSIILFLILFSFTQWAKHVGQARNEALKIYNKPYLLNAKLRGLSDWEIIKIHYIPHLKQFTVNMLPHTLINYLSMITSLNYFGVSVDQSQPTIGSMLRMIVQYEFGPYGTVCYWFGFILVTLLFFSSCRKTD